MTRITKDMKTPWFPADVHPSRPGVYRVTKKLRSLLGALGRHNLIARLHRSPRAGWLVLCA